MGLDPDTSLEIADKEITIPSADEIPEAPVLSVTDRPDYRMLEDKVDLQRENERLVRSDFLPRIGLTAGYHYLGGIELYQTSLEGRGYYLMASAEIPLWQWGEGRYKTQSAKLDSHIAELELEKYKKLMELEIRQAFFAMSEARSRCAMTATALEEAEANMEMSRDFYELGMEQLTDYLEAQARRQQAEAENIAARAEFKIEETNYRHSLGECP
jgi:outer membrane protein TolC